MVIEESRLKFLFPDDNITVKFDDTRFYRKNFNALPGSKAVDFITSSAEYVAFVEVKNCAGDEGNCRWRIFPDNNKKFATNTRLDVSDRDSLDIEVPQKLAMTLAALVGAQSFGSNKETVDEIREFISSDYLSKTKKKYVILFLEGNFGSHTRTKKMIMRDLQQSMSVKLKWFNCKVSVVDSNTYDNKIFVLKR